MSKGERIVKSFQIGDTRIQLTKGEKNLTDYSVTCEDIKRDTYCAITFGVFQDADRAFGAAYVQAIGLNDDLQALMGIEPTLDSSFR